MADDAEGEVRTEEIPNEIPDTRKTQGGYI